ncbi:MAG: NAD(P)-dependent oxidoreductase [Christensenellales bacterium]|jgi:D-3-phosphoglycerate dehydrogenase
MKQRQIACLNAIAPTGLQQFKDHYEIITSPDEADAWLVRSAPLHDVCLPDSLRAIARAGAGVNNIPLARCAEKGIVVFNTPGANANAVAELVTAALVLSVRGIVSGIGWVRSLEAGASLAQQVEKGKSAFQGTEVRGKKLGVIGLGAIGYRVANDAVGLGMEVMGYDPMITPQFAWQLSRSVQHTPTLDPMLEQADFITIHVPLNDKTRGMISADVIARMKEGAVLLNFARAELVDEDAVGQALQAGKLRCYASDFPNEKNIHFPNAILTPHLGASTVESEDNCAEMAVRQLMDYLDNGNIENSVNYPAASLGQLQPYQTRVVVLHRNVPGVISQVTTLFGENHFNIEHMVSSSREGYACALFDVSDKPQRDFIMQLINADEILKVRVIQNNGNGANG